jgi:hypothetical protein
MAGYRCPAGSSWQYGGSPSQSGGSSLYRCSPGTYCPTGSDVARRCPPGTYNEEQARTSITECMIGEVGYIYQEASRVQYGPECPRGYYCGEGTGTLSGTYTTTIAYATGSKTVGNPPTPCPAGTYNSYTLGETVQDCILCPNGRTSNPGSSSLSACV